jgi:hypothetical protein
MEFGEFCKFLKIDCRCIRRELSLGFYCSENNSNKGVVWSVLYKFRKLTTIGVSDENTTQCAQCHRGENAI